MRQLCSLLLGLTFACGPDVPTFPDPPVDAGVECSGSQPCAGDGICLQGRCHAPCTSSAQCASSQTCRDGLCVSGDRPDAGPPPDAGPVCAETCEGATPVCHPSGSCVTCVVGTGECGAAAPVCDFAFGECVAFVDQVCAPCNADVDCGARRCAASGTERVCLAACEAEEPRCPQGFTCNGDSLCAPSYGTCTSVRLGATSASCNVDGDCVPLGVTPDPGVCQGASEGVPGTCFQACRAEMDDCRAGTGCVAGFCRPI
ncbi:MAG: hypothetical protein KF901_33685 [Myxococcales bacterium]|nr:hypothetical protein [Myxococcales bacterium]